MEIPEWTPSNLSLLNGVNPWGINLAGMDGVFELRIGSSDDLSLCSTDTGAKYEFGYVSRCFKYLWLRHFKIGNSPELIHS